jgi:hypothetical protein
VSSQFLETAAREAPRGVGRLLVSRRRPQARASASTRSTSGSPPQLGLWTNYNGRRPETNLGGAEVGAIDIDYFHTPLNPLVRVHREPQPLNVYDA